MSTDDCISNLENNVHDEFASLRYSGRDFAYSAPKEIYGKIDAYCDVDLSDGETQHPMVIMGFSGTGKSALLANWMQRRIAKANRSRSTHEYIFWHAVGCSRQSMNVNQMIRRLMIGLKVHFDLEEKQIPSSQEKLSWELPRFLDLAAKKGKVIILIDGLHRLRNNEELEDNLSWLPLELPPNVKVLVSVTNSMQQQQQPPKLGSTKWPQGQRKKLRSKVITELERRQTPTLKMPSLNGDICRTLIDSYLRNHTSADETTQVSHLVTLGDDGYQAVNMNSASIKGFLLFETQITALVTHPLGGNPQFLRLFMRCLDFVCQRGHSIWTVFNEWIQSSSVADLVGRILETCEQGHEKTRAASQWACDQTLAAGGLKSLKDLYSWHPQLAEKEEKNWFDDNRSESTQRGPFLGSQSHSTAVDNTRPDTNASHHTAPPPTAATAIQQNADRVFASRASVELQAKNKLDIAVARATALANLDDVMHESYMINDHTDDSNINSNYAVIMALVARVPRSHSEELRRRVYSSDAANSVSTGDPDDSFTPRQQQQQDVMSAVSQETDSESENEENNNDDFSATGNDNNKPALNKGKTKASRLIANEGVSPSSPKGSAIKTNSVSSLHSKKNDSNNALNISPPPTLLKAKTSDPGEGFFSLPLYMRGGNDCLGLGDVLGNALSLLLVCRHGLKEKELWAILNDLQVLARAKKQLVERQQEKERENHVRNVLSGIIKEQGQLERILRSEDILRGGFLSRERIFRCVSKVVRVNMMEFELLVMFIFQDDTRNGGNKQEKKKDGDNGNGKAVSSSPLWMMDDGSLDYNAFVANAVKLHRKWHTSMINSALNSSDVLLKDRREVEGEESYADFQLTITRPSTSSASTMKQQQQPGEVEGLGPVVEEMLLQILCALGVLYIPEHKVLVLPSDSEPFRHAISNRYIASTGERSLLYWHNLIVKHFVSQPNCLRKCEELPWHLKICRKWHLLKDTLVDLTMFNLMFKNDLKDELMEYWLLLTEGPLLLDNNNGGNEKQSKYNKTQSRLDNIFSGNILSSKHEETAAAAATDKNDTDVMTTYSHVLKEIDESIALRITLKELRKRRSENELTPFDIVEEYNRSIENWVFKERPSPYHLHDTINHISSFLLQFSRLTSGCPQFRRPGLDLMALVQFDILTALMEQLAPVCPVVIEEYHAMMLLQQQQQQQTANAAAAAAAAAANSANNNASNQKASMLLTSYTATNESNDGEGSSSQDKKYFDRVSRVEKKLFPAKNLDTSKFYLFLRWIWIQFPWLALAPAANLVSKDKEDGNHQHGHGNGVEVNDGFHGGLNHDGDNLEGGGGLGEHALLAPLPSGDPTKHLMRVWNVKKADPTVQVFHYSETRKIASIKPRSSLSSGLERNVDVSYNKLYGELLQPSHVAQVRLGLGKSNKDKFRRTFEQEMEQTKNIPFAYHGVKAMKSGSLFPSFSQQLKEKQQKKIQTELFLGNSTDYDNDSLHSSLNNKTKKTKGGMGKFNLENALRGGGAAAHEQDNKDSTFFLTEVDDELRRLSSEEYLQNFRSDGTIIKNEIDLEVSTLNDRIARMKMIWNKLLIIEREKERSILDLEKDIILREESDTHMINEVQSAELLLHSLHARNVSMEHSLQEALDLQNGYFELLKNLKMNPPFVESHVHALEMEVELAEKQFADLATHRGKLHEEVKRLDGFKKQQLQERIRYFQTARTEIAVKKKQVLKELKHYRDALGVKGNQNGKNNRKNKKKSRKNRNKTDDANNNNTGRRSLEEGSDSSDDSDSSEDSTGDIQLNPQVIHFINALVRKVTYNEPIIKDTDVSLDDVKQRALAAAKEHHDSPLHSNRPSSPTAGEKRRKTKIVMESEARLKHLHDSSSVGSGGYGTPQSHHHGGPKHTGGHQLLPPGVQQHKSGPGPSFQQQQQQQAATGNANNMMMTSLPHTKGHSSTQQSALINQRGRKLSSEQIMQLKDAIKNIPGVNINDTSATGKESMTKQMAKVFEMLFTKTESTSVESFLDRYQQDLQLLENLRQQQALGDSRLTQLKQENAKLLDELNDLNFSSEEQLQLQKQQKLHGNEGEDDGGHEGEDESSLQQQQAQYDDYDRMLDNELFAKEVALHHIQRKQENMTHIVSAARTAIGHIMHQLMMNSKLLAGLSRNAPPPLQSDADMPMALQWCEDTIIALNDSLTMDAANRPSNSNTDETKPIATRQMELAQIVHEMSYTNKRRKQAAQRMKNKSIGGLSKVLMVATESYVSSPRNVLVTAASKLDKAFDQKMTKLLAERDQRAGLLPSSTSTTGVAVDGDDDLVFPGDTHNRNDSKKFLTAIVDKHKKRHHHHHNSGSMSPDRKAASSLPAFAQQALQRKATLSPLKPGGGSESKTTHGSHQDGKDDTKQQDNEDGEQGDGKDETEEAAITTYAAALAAAAEAAGMGPLSRLPDVQRFLAEGLDRNYTRSMSRKAKLLQNKMPGRTSSYGLVLEELMKSRGQVFSFPKASSPKKLDSRIYNNMGLGHVHDPQGHHRTAHMEQFQKKQQQQQQQQGTQPLSRGSERARTPVMAIEEKK